MMLRQGERNARLLRTSTPSEFKPLTAGQLCHRAKVDICSILREQELVYENIEPEVGSTVGSQLR